MAKAEPKKILIVDDQPENLQTIVNIFTNEKEPYTILKAPNGKIALDVMEKVQPDLIITDWEMSEMNGIDFIKHLKSNEETADIPVIMCTGVMTTSENLETALDAGAIDYIRKPIDKIELIARTKANLHLAEKYEEIKNLNHTKDKFFSIIAHDLRAPFNAIIGFANLMETKCSSCENNENNEFVSRIRTSAKNTFELLENLLEWAKSQRGNIPFEPKRSSLKELIDKKINFAEQLSIEKNIEIQNNSNEDIYVSIDNNMIGTVVQNLISNAIKFTHIDGKIVVNTSVKDDFARVDIIDNGVGIHEKLVNDLFRIDKTVTQQGTANEKGTGLGLIICKEFINKHEGEIFVESEEGKGSKFSFTIPLTQ